MRAVISSRDIDGGDIEPETVSHWSHWEAQTRGNRYHKEERAICGAWIPSDSATANPTCAECQRRIAQYESMEF